MKKSILVIICLILSACTASKLQFDQVSLQAMVGKTQTDVVRKLGQPNERYTQDGTTYFVYTTQYENYTPATSETYFNPSETVSIEGDYTPVTCTTIFAIDKSVVQRVHTNGVCL